MNIPLLCTDIPQNGVDKFSGPMFQFHFKWNTDTDNLSSQYLYDPTTLDV